MGLERPMPQEALEVAASEPGDVSSATSATCRATSCTDQSVQRVPAAHSDGPNDLRVAMNLLRCARSASRITAGPVLSPSLSLSTKSVCITCMISVLVDFDSVGVQTKGRD